MCNSERQKKTGIVRFFSETSLSPEDEGTCREKAEDAQLDPQKPEDEAPCLASVQEYLDGCFPAAPPEQPQLPRCSQPPSAPPHLSVQTQYLTTWTLSQALVLRGRRSIRSAASPEKTPPPKVLDRGAPTSPPASFSSPELFSPVSPSPGASTELFSLRCPTPRAEEGGVLIEATTDGLLSSQGTGEDGSATGQASLSKSPVSKKARISENLEPEVSVKAAGSSAAAGLQGPTTPLIRCNRRGVRYSVLVAVVHPCHLKEVKASVPSDLLHRREHVVVNSPVPRVWTETCFSLLTRIGHRSMSEDFLLTICQTKNV